MAEMIGRVALALGLAVSPGLAAAETWDLAGHRVEITEVEAGGYSLTVDGTQLLSDGLIFADDTQTMQGGAVIYGVAGSGGNACEAAPFALWLPEGAKAQLSGPIDTCSYLEATPIEGGMAWSSAPLPGRLSEHWQWTVAGGMQALEPTPFQPDAGRGWADLDSLAGQHPSEALRLEPVYKALTEGLGEADFRAFAERISELGSGDLTPWGYQGAACLKFTCDADWAVLVLDRASQQAFAIWQVEGDTAPRVWPKDTSTWPDGALAALREAVGG